MRKFLAIVCIAMAATGCSVQKYLPEGERLYRGAKVQVARHPDVKTKAGTLRGMLKSVETPHPNKFLLGRPWKVWWWYKIGEPRREKGFRAFLRNRLGEEPVLSSRVNTRFVSENMQSYLENNGYFRSSVTGDTANNGYLTTAVYKAYVNPQYTIAKINWVSDSNEVSKALTSKRARERTVLKPGQPYVLDNIRQERSRLDLYLKTIGYYYFNPNYLMAYVDSTVGHRTVNIYLNLKKDSPESDLHPYAIRSITVFPNYSLISPALDTVKAGAQSFQGVYIKDSVNKFRPILFRRTITYKEGETYNSRRQNSTLNRFINLGSFKFVKNTFERTDDSSYRLNSYYYLTPAPKKSLQGQVDGFYKDNNYIGSQAGINITNRNAFKGAEQLFVKIYGSFETATGSNQKGNDNYTLGANAKLSVPRYDVPLLEIRENNYYQPKTNFSIGYEWFRKNLLYTRNYFAVQYDFTWKPTYQKQVSFAPLSVTYVRGSQITDSFYRAVAANPALMLNVYSEAIIGSTLSYYYNTSNANAVNKFYYGGGIDLAGNILGLTMGAKDYRSKYIFGAPYAQYIKADLKFHYTRRLANGWDWANRAEVGAGIPYGNSRVMPFSKQYIIGGASTVRGFNSRGLGPGSYRPSLLDQRFFQIIGGDMRLLMNTELRIPLSKMFSTAVFVDAGNIWNVNALTTDSTVNGPQAKFGKNWAQQIAVATGFGVRADLQYLLFRIDLGIPVRKPYLPTQDQWAIGKFAIGSAAWRRENLILNFAIGLPF